MSFDFEQLKERFTDVAQASLAKARELTDTGVAKAKVMTEVGKLKVQNSTEQGNIRRAYIELGKLYYAERGSAPEAAYADLCQKITDAKARIAYNNERIADIKDAGNFSDEDFMDLEDLDDLEDVDDLEDLDDCTGCTDCAGCTCQSAEEEPSKPQE